MLYIFPCLKESLKPVHYADYMICPFLQLTCTSRHFLKKVLLCMYFKNSKTLIIFLNLNEQESINGNE